jgi:uncharacterized protein (TIGR01777 family)
LKRIAVSGGTGFIGRHLVSTLVERGDDVAVLSRSPARVERTFGGRVRAVRWDPSSDASAGLIRALDGGSAVINLAGEQAVGVRYTENAKRRIRESRVDCTQRIVDAMSQLEADARPKLLVCASGVNYYGLRPADQTVDETSPPGDDFLASVCVEWEQTARQAEALGARVILTRFGVVLASDGGALTQMARPFKLFVGGRIGSGAQMVSWVHIDDVVGVLLRCLDDESLTGPVNVVSPTPVSNAELSRLIGQALRRPAWLPVPAAALRLAFGDGAEPVLGGQRVQPTVLQRAGYAFAYTEPRTALESCLG